MSIPVKHNIVSLPPLHISLPITTFFRTPVGPDTICNKIASLTLPPTWTLHDANLPIFLCKLKTFSCHPPKVECVVTMSITEELKFEMSFVHPKLNPSNCEVLECSLPSRISTLCDISDALALIDSCTICVGNPDKEMVDMWHKRSLTLHGINGIVMLLLCLFSLVILVPF